MAIANYSMVPQVDQDIAAIATTQRRGIVAQTLLRNLQAPGGARQLLASAEVILLALDEDAEERALGGEFLTPMTAEQTIRLEVAKSLIAATVEGGDDQRWEAMRHELAQDTLYLADAIITGDPPPAGDATMPVFVIKAKDALAVEAVEHYRELCFANGLREQAIQVQLALDEIEGWQSRNREHVHMPDHQHVPATST